MDKALRNAIIAGIVIISFSVCYYLVIFLPQKESARVEQQKQEQYFQEQKSAKEEAIANQEKCRIAGEKAYLADKKIYGSELNEPRYAYSEELKTCIYAGGYRHNDPNAKQCGDVLKHDCNGHWERWVKNSFTNDKIISVVNFTDKNGEWSASTDRIMDYDKQEEEFFIP